MRRAAAAIAIVGASLALAAVAQASGPTLGRKGVFLNGEGFGAVKPRVVTDGGDGSTVYQAITWPRWGGKSASGFGRGLCASATLPNSEWPTCNLALRADELGNCRGHSAYRRLTVYFGWRPIGGDRYRGHYQYKLVYRNLCGKQIV